MADAEIRSDAWADAQRLEAYAGEFRVNLIRLAAVVFFYARHLLDLYFLRHQEIPRWYHLTATAIAVAWTVVAVAIHVALSGRRMPWWLKYASTGFDIAMVTVLGVLAARAGAAQSPLLLLYFPVVATAALRLSLPLVYFATLAGAAGYLTVVACYAWVFVGWSRYYATPELRIPRSRQGIFLLCLLVTGFVAGQVVRQARRLSSGHPVVVPGEGRA